jgi:phage FluMu protein Com
MPLCEQCCPHCEAVLLESEGPLTQRLKIRCRRCREWVWIEVQKKT